MLNAFRHQRLLHRLAPHTKNGCSGCSTPFGIKDCCTVAGVGRLGGERCSTPFGIKDCCTDPLNPIRHHTTYRAQRLSASKIAAPYPTTPSFNSHRCAQRLSASKIAAHLSGDGMMFEPEKCSTPFGIKDCCTIFSPSRPVTVACAQRLSASKIAAPHRRSAIYEPYYVLNAFRHQRLLHSLDGLEHGQPWKVLNAFRHQRLLHLGSGLPC